MPALRFVSLRRLGFLFVFLARQRWAAHRPISRAGLDPEAAVVFFCFIASARHNPMLHSEVRKY